VIEIKPLIKVKPQRVRALVSELVRCEFGVLVSVASVGRLLRNVEPVPAAAVISGLPARSGGSWVMDYVPHGSCRCGPDRDDREQAANGLSRPGWRGWRTTRARPGRDKADLVLTDAERDRLSRRAGRASSAQALALRSRIVLACAQPGVTSTQVAADLRVTQGITRSVCPESDIPVL
jgi:hypothetical protein